MSDPSVQDRYDVIVVGAGPAGSAAALVAARAGLKVLLLERGEYPGAKNVSGAAFYGTSILEPLIPGFWEEAPIERFIVRRTIGLLSDNAAVNLQFQTSAFAQPPYNGVTILRPKFDRWFAGKAAQAGACLIPATVADDVLRNGEQIVGVKVRREQGEVWGNIVIAADGVNSFLAKRAGLQREFHADEISLGVKEVIGLDRRTIEERFNLEGNAGAVHEYLGTLTGPVNGGGFLYTNCDSLSIGVITQISSLAQHRLRAYDLLEQFKHHPAIAPLVRGGDTREYSAHNIPEGGQAMIPQLFNGGIMVVGDAAAFVLAAGLYLEGMNYAIASGVAAAETAIAAHERGDFSRRFLSQYDERLRKSVLPDFEGYRRAPNFVNNPRVQNVYPQMASEVLERVFTVNGRPKQKIAKVVLSTLTQSGLSWRELLGDLWQAARTFGW